MKSNLLRRKLRKVMRQASRPNRLMPYARGVRWQRSILSLAWVQNLFFPRRLRLIRTWVRTCACPDEAQAALGSLMVNTWEFWRAAALRKPEVMRDWLTVEGMDALRQAVEAGRGVILISLHSIGACLVPRLIRKTFQKEIFYVTQVLEKQEPAYVTAVLACQVIEARRLLQQGGIVYFAADGMEGRTFMNMPFFDRLLPIRTGFAGMAVRSAAAALAVFIYFHPDGRITLEFSPLAEPAPGPRDAQVRELVEQYTGMLVARLPRLLPSLKWRTLAQFHALAPRKLPQEI